LEENSEKMKNTLIAELTSKINNSIKTIEGYNNYKVKALSKMNNKGLLLKMTHETGVKWMKSKLKEVEEVIGGAQVKKHIFLVLIKFAPIILDPELKEEKEEIKETSNLSKEAITSMRWIKPIKDQ
ncbi:hypothetical protein C0989_001740, partial [Termitomyces sp. Mn162]